MTGARQRLAVAALVALLACALAVSQASSAPAESGSAQSSKQGKKGKKKRGKKKKRRHQPQQPVQPAQPQQPQATAAPDSETLRAVFVGNNWEGTADVLTFDPPNTAGDAGQFTQIARLNIIPDRDERMLEIATSPDKLAFFLAIRQAVGEGNDQFVDDMYSTSDGRLLVVSRPSFADVVGIELATGEIVWRFPMEGYRSDHMGVSPDGNHVAVSDSTENKVHILEMASGEKVGEFLSGDSPHENTYSKDGSKIFHASIGRVYTPTDQPAFDTTKGDDHFQIVDTADLAHPEVIDMSEKLAEADREDMSSAVRPMALSPDERFLYFQVSFFHGFAEYDFAQDKVTRVADLPNEVPEMQREEYLLDSAHHGIAMNEGGTDLCVAGTMSDYAAIVSRADFTDFTTMQLGEKPYWSTTSDDGEHCFVSWSGTDVISAISYETREEVARIEVGDHPQRVRTGAVRRDWAQSQGG